jgi:membrane protein DedA with SNARE-associated domain
MVAFAIAVYVGNALAPTLIKDAPLVLLILAPKLRWLLLVANDVDPLPYYLVPLVRAGALLTVYYLLGRWYGDRALRWLESRTGNALRPVLWIERNFHRARFPVTFVFPGNVSALLAGADGMPAVVFFAIALGSVALRLWAVRALAEILRGPILSVVEWIGDNQLWLTVVSVAGVMIWAGWSNRHGITTGESVEEIVEDFAGPPEHESAVD